MPRPPPSARLGAAIVDARQAAGLTQAEAARRAGMPAETWWRIEKSKHTPGLDALVKIATALGTSLDALAGAEAPKPLVLRPAERRLLDAVAALDEADIDRACAALVTLLAIQPPRRGTRA